MTHFSSAAVVMALHPIVPGDTDRAVSGECCVSLASPTVVMLSGASRKSPRELRPKFFPVTPPPRPPWPRCHIQRQVSGRMATLKVLGLPF